MRPLTTPFAHSPGYHCTYLTYSSGSAFHAAFRTSNATLCHMALLSLTAYSLPPIGWHIAVYSRGLYSYTAFVFTHYPAHIVLVPLWSLPPSVSLGIVAPIWGTIHLLLRYSAVQSTDLWRGHPFPDGCFLRDRSFLPSVSRQRHIPSPPRIAVRYALPHGCIFLLALCPHLPTLIDLLAGLPSSKARPIRSKGCELFNISKSRATD